MALAEDFPLNNPTNNPIAPGLGNTTNPAPNLTAPQAGQVGVQQGPGQIGWGAPQAPQAPTGGQAPAPGAGGYNPKPGTMDKWNAYINQQKAGKAAFNNAPTWMSNLLHGVGADGSTNQSRYEAEAAGHPIQTNQTYTNWEAAVKAMTGQSDAWEALRQTYDVARNSGTGAYADIHRALLNSGINKETADRLHEMFQTSGGGGENAARRLGVDTLNEYARRGGQDLYSSNYDPSKYAGITTPEAAAQQQTYKDIRDWNTTNDATNGGKPFDTSGYDRINDPNNINPFTGKPAGANPYQPYGANGATGGTTTAPTTTTAPPGTTAPPTGGAPTVGGPKGSMADMNTLFQQAGITNFDQRSVQDALNQGASPADILKWQQAKNAGTLTPDVESGASQVINEIRRSTAPGGPAFNNWVQNPDGTSERRYSDEELLAAGKKFDPNAKVVDGNLVYDKSLLPQSQLGAGFDKNYVQVQNGRSVSGGQDINDPNHIVHDPFYGDFASRGALGQSPGDSTSGFMGQLGKYAPAAISTAMTMGMGAAAGPLIGAILAGTIGPGGIAMKLAGGEDIDWKSVLTNAAISAATGAAGGAASKLLGEAGMGDLMKWAQRARQGYGAYQTIEQIRGG